MKAPVAIASPIAITIAFSCASKPDVGSLRFPRFPPLSPPPSSTLSSSLSFCSSFTSPVLPLLRKFQQLSCRSSSSASFRFAAAVTSMAVATEPVDVLVKAAVGEPEKIGDCPFSQRVLLTLEEKGIPYNCKYVDLTNKPDWFLEINPEGKVPVIKHEGKWVPDSDAITQIIEEKFPEPSFQTPLEKASVGAKIFPSFVKFLKSKDPSDGSEEVLVAELTRLNDYLKDNGPFIHGDQITAADLSLAPKLFHLQVALDHYKKWSLPDNLPFLKSYIEALHARESFLKTKPAEEHVVAGWQKHVS